MEQPLLDRIVSIAGQSELGSNVICPALSIIGLVALESRKREFTANEECPDLITSFNREVNFLPILVSRLADNNVQTVSVTIQVINSLLVGLFLDPTKRNHVYCSIREAALFTGVSQLIENKPVSSSCRPYLYDLQEIIKACIRKTKGMQVDPEGNVYHKLTYESAHDNLKSFVGVVEHTDKVDWAKAGVPEDIQPVDVFNNAGTGWCGMLDLNDFFAEDKLNFKKVFLEQVAFSRPKHRFPLISSSLAVTDILFSLFKVDQPPPNEEVLNGNAETLEPPNYIPKAEENFNFSKHQGPVTQGPVPHGSPALSVESNLSSHSSVERLMANMDNLRPLFFDWPTLHFSGVSNFLRLWQASSAEVEDFDNIKMVVKILFEKATQHAVAASSSSAIDNVVSKLDHISYDEIRATQLKQVENRLNNKWGDEIRHLHRQYCKESQDFVREQRIRLLLNGDWFYVDDPTAGASSGSSISSKSQPQKPVSAKRFFIALSPSRKSLQYGQFPQKLDDIPNPEQLARAVDLQQVSKVVITPLSQPHPVQQKTLKRVALQSRTNYTKISLIGNSGSKDGATLSFYSDTPEKAAAWGDGLLMLKNRSFQSTDTKKYIDMFAETKLRMQILNLSPQDLDNPDIHPPHDISSYDRSQISTSFYYR
ncbi:hypothetical protein TRICI_002163 [Trichomonascus ciferrii]|uniref:ELMO domain-containing protein n=1 Tax=Trichomonascus ciferrii TaxID=44093 RepID=A0A642V8U9_9ASCO|nr:hypothetical protein TRICI_002163 [Trichomonascus ciferrii]